jgi:hypothetical protein
MKKFLLLFFALSTAYAQQDPNVKHIKCTFEDYKFMGDMLKAKPVNQGAELKNAFVSVLYQEMGPVCAKVINLRPMIGISGERLTTYKLQTGDLTYTFVDVSTRINANRNVINLFVEKNK